MSNRKTEVSKEILEETYKTIKEYLDSTNKSKIKDIMKEYPSAIKEEVVGLEEEIVSLFLLCIKEAITNKELITEFNRLNNTRIGVKDSRSKIEKMIDQSIGYSQEIENRFIEEMEQLIDFISSYIFAPVLVNFLEDEKNEKNKKH